MPTTRLRNYFIDDPDPIVKRHPGGRPYRFFDASREVHFLHAMLDRVPRLGSALTLQTLHSGLSSSDVENSPVPPSISRRTCLFRCAVQISLS